MTWKNNGQTEAFNSIKLTYEDNSYDPRDHIAGFNKGDAPFYISKEALVMLRCIPSYDQRLVMHEIKGLLRNPHKNSSLRHKTWHYYRLIRTKAPFANHHFLIEYSVNSPRRNQKSVHIERITFDTAAVGDKARAATERSLMYEVQQNEEVRKNNSAIKYDGPKKREELALMQTQWGDLKPTPYARTEHITVNGMQNELLKAAWLMGVHTQVAYDKDNVTKYTLVHNPTEGNGRGVLDVVECSYDKVGTSHNAQLLSAIIEQRIGKPTKWTLHSQGGIIFKSALQHFANKHRGYTRPPLVNHQVALHAIGTNDHSVRTIVESLGGQVVGVRTNPFDFVPNVLGRQSLRLGSFSRCLRFANDVMGDKELGVSPHTLPYIGPKVYFRQLMELGHKKHAKHVYKYMQKHCK